MESNENVLKINIDSIIPNTYQPRKTFNEDSLSELASSIKEYGILNPILVRKKNNIYEIVAGERRLRAAKIAGLTEVPVIVRDIEDSKMAEIALIENLQRENISPIEEAKSYQDILKLSNITEKKLSEMIGKSQSFISNKLRLLTLPTNIQEALINRKISERHARSLMTVEDKEKQTALLKRIIDEKLTVKELDNIINEKKITEEEIQSAINDIMKSLNIGDDNEETQKEEKESDNMNNGNFFPSYNNMEPNTNASLNSMNMQTMNATQVPQAQVVPDMSQQMANPAVNMDIQIEQPPMTPQVSEAIPEQISPIPDFGNIESAIVASPIPEQTPQMVEPAAQLVPQPSVDVTPMPNPIPDFNIQTPSIEPSTESTQVPNAIPELTVPTPTPEVAMDQINSSISPIPQFSESTQVPKENSIPQMIDPPLFGNSELSVPNQNVVNPVPDFNVASFEVPVSVDSVPEIPNIEEDKLTQLESFLNNNEIEYKAYSNESRHCIIIEI